MTSPSETSATPAGAAPRLLGGRYRLEERLGEGTLGVVWRARHVALHRDFALKQLRTGALEDPAARARFHREAEALGRMRHPHIVEVTDFGIDPESGSPYLVMELLPGRTLADLLRETGPLPPERALPLLEALAGAIDAAHEQGILHRDLKPSNIALTTDAEGEPLLKVLDFGLAAVSEPRTPDPAPQEEETAAGESLTSTGMLLGTPLYAAPEVIRGAAASRASDVYSLGVIAYEMLTGRPPFQGTTSKVLSAHLHAAPPSPALPGIVCEALHEPLDKEPEHRPATAAAFVRRLRHAIERSEAVRWRRAELPRRAAMATGVAAASLAAVLLLFPSGDLPIERRLDDLRMELAFAREHDPRILLVTMDQSSQRERSVPLGARADEVGKSLSAIFAAGARGVAVDLVLPPQWSDSQDFQNLLLHHPDDLTLAASSGDGNVDGSECVADLTEAALGHDRTAALFGFVNLDEDADRVTRTGRLAFHDIHGVEHPSWAARAASMLGPVPRPLAGPVFRIDHRVNGHLYKPLLWRDLPAALTHQPELFRSRLVLVGGDFPNSGDDNHYVPVSLGETGRVSGLTLQALQVDTIAAGLPVREAPHAPVLLLAALAAACVALSALLGRRPSRTVAIVPGLAALYTAASLSVFRQTGLLLPITAPCLVVALCLTAALLLRRRLPPIPIIRSLPA
ncbi:MAG TPA: protein kinase [Thermoanaerobaculia bacterium]|jgi:serine/threonine protein kinase|nr:protein kinase [Thermoanaerobaculia bacterium]